jgi:hypothetical protein
LVLDQADEQGNKMIILTISTLVTGNFVQTTLISIINFPQICVPPQMADTSFQDGRGGYLARQAPETGIGGGETPQLMKMSVSRRGEHSSVPESVSSGRYLIRYNAESESAVETVVLS